MALFGLRRDERGNVAVIFGLLLIPLLGMIGFAIDASRAYSVRAQLQQSLDAAALAGGRLYGFADRDVKIKGYFEANWKSGVYGAMASDITIQEDKLNHQLKVYATAQVRPLLVKFVGVGTVTVGASSTVVDSNATLEVALAIDTTGSMSETSGGVVKMTAAKNAATLLLDILFNKQPTDDKLFLSVVPFVQNVNVGPGYGGWLASGSQSAVPWNTGPYPTSSGWRGCMFERLDSSGTVRYDTTEESPVTQRFLPFNDNYLKPTCTNWTASMNVTAGQCVYNTVNHYYYEAQTAGRSTVIPNITAVNNAVFALGGISWKAFYPRWTTGEALTGTGNYRLNPDTFFFYTNQTRGTTTGSAAPSHLTGTATSGGISWKTTNDYSTMSRVTQQDPYFSAQYGYGYNSGCGSQVVPMTSTRATAQATINALQPSVGYGGTMTNVGLMWAWRTIAPAWRGLWSGVASDRPKDYTEPQNFKAIIILTDGENVFTQSGVPFFNDAATPYGYLSDGRLGTTTGSTAETKLDAKVTAICTNARAKGILLYAVMFDLPSGASSTKTLFQNCVGDLSHFFTAENQAELETAFQTIALDLSKLRISR